jgi:positive regulator of sigma E activity
MATQKRSKKPNRSKATASRVSERIFETDGTYFLKLVIFVLLGTLWLKFQDPVVWMGVQFSGVPAGMLVGLVLVRQFERIQSDRKIWYAVLIVITIICAFAPVGIFI